MKKPLRRTVTWAAYLPSSTSEFPSYDEDPAEEVNSVGGSVGAVITQSITNSLQKISQLWWSGGRPTLTEDNDKDEDEETTSQPSRPSLRRSTSTSSTPAHLPRASYRPTKPFEKMSDAELVAFHTSKTSPTLNRQYQPPRQRAQSMNPSSRPLSTTSTTADQTTFIRTDHAGQTLQLTIDILLLRCLNAYLTITTSSTSNTPHSTSTSTNPNPNLTSRSASSLTTLATHALTLATSSTLNDQTYISRSCFYLALAAYEEQQDRSKGDIFLQAATTGGSSSNLKGCPEEPLMAVVRRRHGLRQRQRGVATGKERGRPAAAPPPLQQGESGNPSEKLAARSGARSSLSPSLSRSMSLSMSMGSNSQAIPGRNWAGYVGR